MMHKRNCNRSGRGFPAENLGGAAMCKTSPRYVTIVVARFAPNFDSCMTGACGPIQDI
jgi:hypothetical protein